MNASGSKEVKVLSENHELGSRKALPWFCIPALSEKQVFLLLSVFFFLPNGSPCVKTAIKYCPHVLAQLLPHFREESATCGRFTELILWDQRKPVCIDGHAQRMCGVPCFSQVAQPRARAKPQNNRLVRLQNKQESVQLKSRLARGRPQSPGLLSQVCEGRPWLPTAGCPIPGPPVY